MPSLTAVHKFFLKVRSCLYVKSDSVHICTETVFIFQEILRAKSDFGALMQFDRRPMALPYPYGRRLEDQQPHGCPPDLRRTDRAHRRRPVSLLARSNTTARDGARRQQRRRAWRKLFWDSNVQHPTSRQGRISLETNQRRRELPRLSARQLRHRRHAAAVRWPMFAAGVLR